MASPTQDLIAAMSLSGILPTSMALNSGAKNGKAPGYARHDVSQASKEVTKQTNMNRASKKKEK